MVTVPFVVSSKVGDNKGEYPDWSGTAVVCIITFFIVLVYFTLNEVARDLEDPYNHDPNELALVIMQRNFNSRIQALTNEKGYEVERGLMDLDHRLYSSRQAGALIQDMFSRVSSKVEAIEADITRIRRNSEACPPNLSDIAVEADMELGVVNEATPAEAESTQGSGLDRVGLGKEHQL